MHGFPRNLGYRSRFNNTWGNDLLDGNGMVKGLRRGKDELEKIYQRIMILCKSKGKRKKYLYLENNFCRLGKKTMEERL
jgi:hypothetical protein